MKSLIIALLLASPAAAQHETASFLKITPGARPMAMGEAYTAVADDLDSLNSNPAGLARMSLQQATFEHAELFAGTHLDYAGYARPFATDAGTILDGGTLALGVEHLSQPALEGRDAAGNPTGSFGAGDTAVMLGYSRRLADYPAVLGANVKYLHSTLADTRAQGYAVDLGAQRPFYALGHGARLGVSVRNLGPGMKFGGETDPLPLELSVGGAVNVVGAMTVALDVHQRPRDHQTALSIGTEYSVLPAFALRTGYASASAAGGSSGIGALGGFGMGFGLKVYKATLDYSFSPYGELGSAQRLSLSSRF